MKTRYTSLLLLLILVSSISAGVKGSAKPIKAIKLIHPLTIDGRITETVYNNEAIVDFTQHDPDEGKPVTEETKMWISYDESNIYFSGMFYDSQPDSIDQSLMRRDNMTSSDWLWIYMDPYNDDRTGFYFAVNAGGSICDGTLYNDGWMDDSWDGIWETKTNVDERGWGVEVRIPFSQLRFKEAEEMTWGINLNRDIKRKHEMSFYVMTPRTESGFNSNFADLVGLDGIKPKQRFEVLPYFVQKAQYLVHDNNDPFYKGNQYQTSVGADIKFSLGSNLNVDATFNPDFGQVEVDPAVVNLSAFENFYDEKRPFFIEGANTFQFGYGGSNNNWGFNFGVPELFYSRRIGRPPQGRVTGDNEYVDYPNEARILGAAKLTGKIDESWSIGALSAFTERTHAELNSSTNGKSKEEVEPFTHYGVLRSSKEFNGGNQGLGMIFTSVNRDLQNDNLSRLLSKQAYTFGADGWTFLDTSETYVLTGSLIGSYLQGSEEYMIRAQKKPYRYFQRPDKTYMPLDSNLTSLTGAYGRLMLNKQKGNFYINAALGAVTPGFEYNDLGSQWFADRITGHVVLGYRWFEPDETFRQKNLYFAFTRSADFEDNVSRIGFYTNGSLQFLNFWGISANSSVNFEAVSTTLTRGGPKVTQPANFNINLSAYTDRNEKIIVGPYAGYWTNDLGSYSYHYGVELRWKPSTQIDLTVDPMFSQDLEKTQWVNSYGDHLAANTFGRRYVFGELDQKTISANIRLNWTFSPTISLQLYVQPLIAVGNYSNFKELARSSTMDYNIFGTNESTINYNSSADTYEVDPDGAGSAESFTIHNPNFNYKSLRGNMVLRWEVLPGSVFYFAWTNARTNFRNPGQFEFGRDFKNLLKAESDNVFLVKFSYWLDV